MDDDTLDGWIGRLNVGDVEAVGPIFGALEPALRIAIRRRLGRRLRVEVDSNDVLQSVFAAAVIGVRAGGWRFEGRAPLLALLKRIAVRRIADRHRQRRHALGREQSLFETAPGEIPASDLPRPSQEAQGREFWDRLVRACPPAHREIVRLRVQGLTLGEIAGRTGLHEGSVRRILYELARRLSVARRSAPVPVGVGLGGED